jgi:succinoglycan biosynthesis transport protein ExoP
MTTADVYRALWRHRFFIIVLTALMAAGVAYLTSQQTKTYEATTLIRVQQRIASPSEAYGTLVLGQRLAQTYSRIVETGTLKDAVRARVQETLLNPSSVDLSAEPVEDLELLAIRASSSSPRTAQAAANATPPALREFISRTGTLRDQIVTIDRADLPTSPAAPNLTLNIVIAIMLGLVFNGALALLLELVGDRLPSPDELEVSLGKPVLATIPVLKFARRSRTSSAESEVMLEPMDYGPSGSGRAAEEGAGRSAIG